MGETSGAIADCIVAGVPAIASAVGSTRELPDDVVVKVAPDIGVTALAEAITALLDDTQRRAALSTAARALARSRSFAETARFVYDELVRRPPPPMNVAAVP
jgi:glycosyltransferase involved in cell wall biosynthesis